MKTYITIFLLVVVVSINGCGNESDISETPEVVGDYLVAEPLDFDSRIYPSSCYGFAKEFYSYLSDSLIPALEKKDSPEIIKLRKQNKVHYRHLAPCGSSAFSDLRPKELNFEFYSYVAVTLTIVDMYMLIYAEDSKNDCPCLMAEDEAKKLQAYIQKYSTYLAP